MIKEIGLGVTHEHSYEPTHRPLPGLLASQMVEGSRLMSKDTYGVGTLGPSRGGHYRRSLLRLFHLSSLRDDHHPIVLPLAFGNVGITNAVFGLLGVVFSQS